MKDQRIKLMIDKLVEQCHRGTIDNEWVESFIFSVKDQFDKGIKLSEKQIIKLEEIFERY